MNDIVNTTQFTPQLTTDDLLSDLSSAQPTQLLNLRHEIRQLQVNLGTKINYRSNGIPACVTATWTHDAARRRNSGNIFAEERRMRRGDGTMEIFPE